MNPQSGRHVCKVRLDEATLRRLKRAAACRVSASRLAADAVAARLPRWSRKHPRPAPCRP
ncbi:MAG: hypothetical protein LBI02_02265 [Opitutaceae bacterium]|jgi:hypothetical protein|nr:hypothetical protein [Opitutaceae bacterium]